MVFRDCGRQDHPDTTQRRAQVEGLRIDPGRCTRVLPTGRRRHRKAIPGTRGVVLPGTLDNTVYVEDGFLFRMIQTISLGF